VFRLFPTPGPDSVAGTLLSAVLSRALGVDASNMVHVTRYRDVLEVLERDADFSVRLYDDKMKATTGEFILGMNEPERYEPEAKILRGVVRREDAALVRRIAAEETAAALDAVRGRGALDLVRDVADVVPIRFVNRYYGTKVEDPESLLRLYQTTSKYLFAFWDHPAMRAQAAAAGGSIRGILTRILEERRQSGSFGDEDLIGRLLASPEKFPDGDAGIARSIAGLSSGNINAPLGLFILSVDKILSLPAEVQDTTRELARASGKGIGADDAAFRDAFVEAERFCVYPPFSYRYAERDTTLAEGTDRETRIPRGSTVVTWQSFAAFDPDVFDAPYDFRPGRPGWQYNGFGHGRHHCLGEQVGQIMLEEMARGLFALPGIRRAPGDAGVVKYASIPDGKYALSFGLVFDRAS
jgi:cytochrome P450